MKKQHIRLTSALLLMVLLLGLPPTALAAERVSAKGGSIDITFNGTAMKLGAYNIANSNYVKLRDLGAALDFCVDWDGSSVIVDTSRGYSQGASSAPPAAPSAGGAVAYSDEQLLALAQEAVEDMFEMSFRLDCYGILDFSWDETISAVPLGGSSEYPWTYYRAPGYSTATQARAAMEQEWYRHFSRRYTIEQVMGKTAISQIPICPTLPS